ncbi:hypothetical protein [Flavobacterium sp. 3HN19-14]|uniref:hypothetical protein n=1 Tax=Flavobacterium sp. 3HN19-14 TaxID=3448133 RepID=UPI003EDF66AF
MKKFILIAVVLLVAVVGLTSYNGKEEVKNDGRLIAQIKGEPGGVSVGTTQNPTPPGGGGTLKKD